MAYRSILSGEMKGLGDVGMPHARDVPDQFQVNPEKSIFSVATKKHSEKNNWNPNTASQSVHASYSDDVGICRCFLSPDVPVPFEQNYVQVNVSPGWGAVSFSDGFPATKVDQSQFSDQARSQDWDPGQQKLGKQNALNVITVHIPCTNIMGMYGNWGGIGSNKLVNQPITISNCWSCQWWTVGLSGTSHRKQEIVRTVPKVEIRTARISASLSAHWSPLRASNFRILVICLPWAYEAVPQRVGIEKVWIDKTRCLW